MGISGFFGKRNLSKVDIDIELPDEIYANTSLPLKVTLTNKRNILPVFLIRARIEQNEMLFPFVDAKGKDAKYMNFMFGQRGIQRMERIHICSVFPFKFFVRCKKISRVSEFIVFPDVRKCGLPTLFERRIRSRGETPSDVTGYESEMISLRDYSSGDPLKYIHWKASAKTGKLKTKELSALSYQPVIIDFDKVSIRNVEEKISCITYIILKLFKQNTPVGLKIKDRVYRPGITNSHKLNMLKELALYGKD